jgi:hypothetical protein
MNTAQNQVQENNEDLDKDKWRTINCTFKKIMLATPENEGTLIVVDFKARTYEVFDANVITADFKAPKTRKKRNSRR